jgi:hypothetical protein
MPQTLKQKRKAALRRLQNGKREHIIDFRPKQNPRTPEARQAEIDTLTKLTKEFT